VNDPTIRKACVDSNYKRISEGSFHLHTDEMKSYLVSKEVSDRRTKTMSDTSKKMYSEGKSNLNDPMFYINSRYSEFINRGNLSDICHLYISNWIGNIIKIGVTLDLDYRSIAWIEGSQSNYLDIKSLKSGDRLNIGKLEREIKIKLIPFKYCNSNEQFLKKDEVKIMEIINKYINNQLS